MCPERSEYVLSNVINGEIEDVTAHCGSAACGTSVGKKCTDFTTDEVKELKQISLKLETNL